jgi:cell division protein FtsB
MRRVNSKPQSKKELGVPRYAALAIVASIAFMLCLTINYRAFCDMSREVNENQNLSGQIQDLTNENLALQDEIHNLKTDSAVIRREARRLGIIDGSEQSLVPATK